MTWMHWTARIAIDGQKLAAHGATTEDEFRHDPKAVLEVVIGALSLALAPLIAPESCTVEHPAHAAGHLPEARPCAWSEDWVVIEQHDIWVNGKQIRALGPLRFARRALADLAVRSIEPEIIWDGPYDEDWDGAHHVSVPITFPGSRFVLSAGRPRTILTIDPDSPWASIVRGRGLAHLMTADEPWA